MKIAVLGAGSWGVTLANHLSLLENDVCVYTRNPKSAEEINKLHTLERYLPGTILHDQLKASSDVKACLTGTSFVILAVPSQQMAALLKVIKDDIPKDAIIINIAKGIEVGTNRRMEEVVMDILPQAKYVTLSGPTHAEEVIQQIPSAIVAASHVRDYAEAVQDLFFSGELRVYTNDDLVGVELGGALKNVLALGIGIVDGIGFGDNTRAAMLTRGLLEMTRLGIAMGAKQETFSGLSGMGDLIVTATSPHSRNRRAGILLGQGKTLDETLQDVGMVVEGIKTTESAHALGKELGIDLPITNEIYALLYEDQSIEESVKNLMGRKKKKEMEPMIGSNELKSK